MRIRALVAHCRSSTQGFDLFTLCAVDIAIMDIATKGVELEAVWPGEATAASTE